MPNKEKMDEVAENSVIHEEPPQQTENQEVKSQEPSQTLPENKQDRKFREMRLRQAELEKNLKAQMEMNEKLINAMTSQTPKAQEVDELDAIDDSEYLPKGKVKQLVEKRAQKIAEEAAKRETEKFMQQQQQNLFMDRLKRQYPDFEDVVNAETLSIFEEKEPELAATISESKDPYKIGVQAYKYIKALNISDDAPKVRRAKEVEKKLEENAKTVQSPQAFDKRPMAQAFKLTEAEKTKLYDEMMGFARMASAVPELT